MRNVCRQGHDISRPESRAKDGRCILCKRAKDRRYFEKEEQRVINRRARSKAWREDNPERSKLLIRKAFLNTKYGITLEEYEQKLEEQNYRCYICGNIEHVKGAGGTIKLLSVDHDHKTGKIRKLLCHNCNAAIGHVSEDITLLLKIIDYLKDYKNE